MPRGAGALVTLALALLAVAAAAPLGGAVDAWLDRALDAVRTCRGLAWASELSALVRPVGLSALGLAVLHALWRGRPRLLQIAGVIAATGAGALLVGALKDVLDRPRPGAEFLLPGGGSFPSGHVGNTMVNGIAILTLVWGGVHAGWRRRGTIVLAAVLAIIAAARIYERRHWLSDTVAAIAIAGAYGVLAMRHPDARWRVGATLVGLAVALAAQAAVSRGFKIDLPAGAATKRGWLERVTFGTAFEDGRLRGDWALDAPDPRRRSAWLRSDAGGIVLPARADRVDEVRLVARPRSDLDSTDCPRLQVALNGRALGDSILQPGWRAYVFPTRPADFHPGDNVLALRVSGDELGPGAASARRAAFSELTLHVARP